MMPRVPSHAFINLPSVTRILLHWAFSRDQWEFANAVLCALGSPQGIGLEIKMDKNVTRDWPPWKKKKKSWDVSENKTEGFANQLSDAVVCIQSITSETLAFKCLNVLFLFLDYVNLQNWLCDWLWLLC